MAQQTEERTDQPLPYPHSQLLTFLERMLLVRRFEEKTLEMTYLDKVRGYCHLNIGEEATVVGSVAALRDQDELITSYRDHGYAIARNTDPRNVMAELFGKESGCAGGRGGSMHMVNVDRGYFGGYGIVGGHLPLAAGLALAIDYQGQDRAVLCSLGDGATNIGAFHESLNLARIWNLPVVWMIVNNQYAMGTPVAEASAEPDLYRRACAYRMHGEQVDGMDVLAVYEAAERLLRMAREQREPSVLEAVCYRYEGHSYADAGKSYRTQEEIDRWRLKDPIRTFQRYLEEHGLIDQAGFESLDRKLERQVDEAVSFADASPFPSPESLFDYVYANEEPR